jgi:cytochrome c7-like protein
MAALFPRWSNTAVRVVVIAALGGGAAAVLAPMIWVRTPWVRHQNEPIDQPVQFDHRHHGQDDGIHCVYCHTSVYKAANAGIPSTDKCMGCHSQIWNQSPMLDPVRRAYFSGMPIPWNRVHDLPDFVYFNHSIHVNKGVGCSTCHGRVDAMPQVYQVAPLTMGWCLNCHREPAAHLRPLSQITNMRFQPEEQPASVREQLAAELGVVSQMDCSACHR